MTAIKIYTASPSDLSPPVQSESFCVDLVLASDYQALEARCAALAAENAALKKSEVEFNEYCCHECEDVGGTWVDDFTETPATDAFLAEIRAQFWVEGNEPTEFGRYWVRYETDVGPLYCSARWLEHNFCAGSDTNIHRIWLADHSRSINSLRGVTHYTKLPDSLEGGAQ